MNSLRLIIFELFKKNTTPLEEMGLIFKLVYLIPWERGCRASLSPANWSWASWFSESPPSQLIANQNRLRALRYVWQAPQLCHTSSNSISSNKYLAYTFTKSLFLKNLNLFIKFLMLHKQFVLKCLLLLRLTLLILFF